MNSLHVQYVQYLTLARQWLVAGLVFFDYINHFIDLYHIS